MHCTCDEIGEGYCPVCERTKWMLEKAYNCGYFKAISLLKECSDEAHVDSATVTIFENMISSGKLSPERIASRMLREVAETARRYVCRSMPGLSDEDLETILKEINDATLAK